MPGCRTALRIRWAAARLRVMAAAPRVTPQGLRIARWYCPEGRRTFSLLPDFVAARLPAYSLRSTIASP